MNEFLLNNIIEKLPEEPGIMNSSNYLKSAVLASLYTKENELHLIFQKRNSSIRQGSEICFPGGRFDEEKDKNMLETSVRETMEEMGINRENIIVLGQTDTLVAPMGAIISCFLGELKITDLSELNINKDEVERIFSVPLKWFLDNPPLEYNVHMEIKPEYTDKNGNEVILLPVEELGLPDRYRKPWGLKNHKIYAYKTNGETIWGITAQMTKHICELLKDVI
ncbi:MAG: CoA pyrophosphatase [Spirochaetaceae bacterium]|jgi:coenzyme A diphosphatase NUDT7|nr:CoA pyrophosphatase [Spirochaetaceae bacterium]